MQPKNNDNDTPQPSSAPIYSSKWRLFFIVLAIVDALALFVSISTTILLHFAAAASFAIAIILLPLVPVIWTPIIVTCVVSPVYIIMYHSRRDTTFGLAVVSLFIVLAFMMSVFIPGYFAEREYAKSKAIADTAIRELRTEIDAFSHPEEITLARAEELMRSCQVPQYYYDFRMLSSVENAEKSSTGIYLMSSPKRGPWRITAAASIKDRLEEVAQEAQATCDGQPFINADN